MQRETTDRPDIVDITDEGERAIPDESVSVPVGNGSLALGTWQSVLLIECDGPRTRSISVTCVS